MLLQCQRVDFTFLSFSLMYTNFYGWDRVGTFDVSLAFSVRTLVLLSIEININYTFWNINMNDIILLSTEININHIIIHFGILIWMIRMLKKIDHTLIYQKIKKMKMRHIP